MNSTFVIFYAVLFDDVRALDYAWLNDNNEWRIAELPYPVEILPTVQALMLAQGMAGTPMAMFAQRVANARECAGTTCAVIEQLQIGTRVDVTGQVAGEVYRENDQWYQVRLDGGQQAFVHVSLLGPPVVSTTVPATISVPAAAPISVPQSQPQLPSSPYTCNGRNDLNCDDFPNGGSDEQTAMCNNEDLLDGDGDGDACEPGFS
ncbi:MAG: SH3 domain-containing protein [Burkholderiales bacterium]|nr:SH3 domain-containing protein [Anaerolineae bacterium]